MLYVPQEWMISVANTKTACFINKYDVLQQKSVCSSDLEQFVTEARLGLGLIKSPKMKLHSYTLQVFWRGKKKNHTLITKALS